MRILIADDHEIIRQGLRTLLSADKSWEICGEAVDGRDAIEKAWAFETDPSHDTDHDGIYDNSQGTGWVESWPGGMPHQEIYLALLDQQASTAFSYIEDQLHDSSSFLVECKFTSICDSYVEIAGHNIARPSLDTCQSEPLNVSTWHIHSPDKRTAKTR